MSSSFEIAGPPATIVDADDHSRTLLDRENDLELVLSEERELIQRLQADRWADGRADTSASFALAFSGGGMRAAAFQCGVLWRLAELDLLKNVTYFTAVSGGGYTSMAFATHCFQAWKDEPPTEGKVKSWYQRVVAQTIVRMQQNSGNFVRDFVRSGPGPPLDNSGCMPRCCRVMDIPILLCTLMIAMIANPILIALFFIIPVTSVTENFVGDTMREAFCNYNSTLAALKVVLAPEDDNFATLREAILASICTTVVLFLMKLLPCFKDPRDTAKKGDRVQVPSRFLMIHCLFSFLVRVSIVLAVYWMILFTALLIQIYFFQGKPDQRQDDWNLHFCVHRARDCLNSSKGCIAGFWWIFSVVAGAVLVVSVIVMPYMGSRVFLNIVCILGPLVLGIVQVRIIQFRIFGPLTGQDFFPSVAYSDEFWDHFRLYSNIALLIILPLYPELRGILHTYYMRCLSHNFFALGQDMFIANLASCPYCPLNIVTGTSSDYRPPIGGNKDAISEISFTALHVGSVETGYVRTPEDRTVGKCTALTAAGCIDACALTLSQLLTLRFWLEILNLSWGDYILFEKEYKERWLAKFLGWKGEIDKRLSRRLPVDICLVSIGILILMERNRLALSMFTILSGCSFFSGSFIGCIDMLCLSPFLRQLQQATNYCYRGEKPPPMLYVTDGGCRDCTTLMQLVLRRELRILMVLAANDPDDDLAVLRVAMDMAKKAGLAAFYNPVDPRLDVDEIFTDFKNNKAMMHIHIGITYPKDEGRGSTREFGHLFIVKNRLPVTFHPRHVEPHLTEEEVRGEVNRGAGLAPDGIAPFEEQNWDSEMLADQLGPLCCCDCSHYRGCNYGPKWPHGSFSNFMYMTPMWCSSLTRLAYDMSDYAIKAMLKHAAEGTHTPSNKAHSRSSDPSLTFFSFAEGSTP